MGATSYWTRRNYRDRIAQKIIEFMGVDILKDIVQCLTGE